MSKIIGYQIAPKDLFTTVTKTKVFGEEWKARYNYNEESSLLVHLELILKCRIDCVKPRKENATDEECRFVFVPEWHNYQSEQEPQGDEINSFKGELQQRGVDLNKLNWVNLDTASFRTL